MKRPSRSDSQARDVVLGRIRVDRMGASCRLGILLVGLLFVIPIAHAGKPVSPPPPPPPPPVRYQLIYLDTLGADYDTEALEMNDLGTIVGTATNTVTGVSRAVMWMPTGDIFDLNTGATWNEPGWTATEAPSVNAVNQIGGRATKTGSPDRVFIYDMATAQFLLLPQVEGQTSFELPSCKRRMRRLIVETLERRECPAVMFDFGQVGDLGVLKVTGDDGPNVIEITH